MRGRKLILVAAVLASLTAVPAFAASNEGVEEPGLFSRTWDSIKDLFSAVGQDSQDAAHKTAEVGKEGFDRAMGAGAAIGDAAVEGAKGVKKAIMGPPPGDDDAAGE